MIMRWARAHSSSCSQVVLVYLHLFCRNSLFCSWKSQKIIKNRLFWGFKVIYVDTTKMHVTSAACYGKQHVCTYLQPFSRCLGLSAAILVQFTLEMCVAAQNRKKIH